MRRRPSYSYPFDELSRRCQSPSPKNLRLTLFRTGVLPSILLQTLWRGMVVPFIFLSSSLSFANGGRALISGNTAYLRNMKPVIWLMVQFKNQSDSITCQVCPPLYVPYAWR
jgi:hypothetical protein